VDVGAAWAVSNETIVARLRKILFIDVLLLLFIIVIFIIIPLHHAAISGPVSRLRHENVSISGPESGLRQENAAISGPESGLRQENVSISGPESGLRQANAAISGPESGLRQAKVSNFPLIAKSFRLKALDFCYLFINLGQNDNEQG